LDDVTDPIELFVLMMFQENNTSNVDAQAIEEKVSQAIKNWKEVTKQC